MDIGATERTAELDEAALHCYGLRPHDLEPLITWDRN